MIRAEKLASVGRLASGIAHEIGNPVGIIGGYLDLIKSEDISSEERRDYLKRTEIEMERMGKTIRNLLDFARMGEYQQSQFSVHEVIRDVTDFLTPQAAAVNVDIHLKLSADHDLVLGDPYQLRQVFINILLNAVDAITEENRETGLIEFQTKTETMGQEDGSNLLIRIQDNGSGISSENMGSIFDPFFSTKEVGKGTGLGLSVSYSMVHEMGGNIEIESEAGRGTVVSVFLPVLSGDPGEGGPENDV
jgi:signal transduction histidine kinase